MSLLVFFLEISHKIGCPLENDEGVDWNSNEHKGQKDHPKNYIFLKGGAVLAWLLWLLGDMDLELLVVGLLIFEVDIVELPLEESVGFDVLGEAVVLWIFENAGDQAGLQLPLYLRDVSFSFWAFQKFRIVIQACQLNFLFWSLCIYVVKLMNLSIKSTFMSSAVPGPSDGLPWHSLKILSCIQLVKDKYLGLQAQISSQWLFLLHYQATVLVRGL